MGNSAKKYATAFQNLSAFYQNALKPSKSMPIFAPNNSMLLFHYTCMVTWWGILYAFQYRSSEANAWYQVAYTSMPLIWGIVGIEKSYRWGNRHVGRALFFTSCGLVSWGIGQLFWSVLYNLILQIEIPYPSLADFGFVTSIPLWIMGVLYLTKATGITVSFEKIRSKIFLFTIPMVLIASSYYLLIIVARDGIISDLQGGYGKVFLDFAYPLGDMVILFLSVLAYGLSLSQLRGRYKGSILTILFGFIAMFFTDFAFSYTTTQGTYYNGHWLDILFPTALTFISMGVNNFQAPRKNSNTAPNLHVRKLPSSFNLFSLIIKREPAL